MTIDTQSVQVPVHPSYAVCAPLWREYRLSYEGGPEYLAAYLRKHPKEIEAFYAERLERAYYPNKSRSTVDTYAAYLYQRPIKREGKDELLTDLWSDVDRKGSDADAFFRRAAVDVQITGRVGVVVDRYQPGEAHTRADERAMGIRPYGSIARAEDIVDWDVDDQDELVWAIVRERADVSRQPFGGDPEAEWAYRLWTREGWSLHTLHVEGEGEGDDARTVSVEVERGEHPLGRVPIAMAFWGERAGLLGESALRDISPANRRLTNFASLIDEQCNCNVFSILVTEESTADELDDGNWGADGVVVVPNGTRFKPFYLSSDPGQIDVLRREMAATEDEIRMMSGLGRVNNDATQVKSGIALSYLTMDKQALLGSFAATMERLERDVADLAAAWMGQESDASIEYARKFDPAQFAEELTRALDYSSLPDLPPSARRANVRAATAARFKDSMDAGELTQLLEDVDAETTATSPVDTDAGGATRASTAASADSDGMDTRGER